MLKTENFWTGSGHFLGSGQFFSSLLNIMQQIQAHKKRFLDE